MVFEQNYARRETHLLYVTRRLLSDDLREFQPWIRIGDEDGRRSAADDIVGEKFHRGKIVCARRTQDLVYIDGTSMSDTTDVWQTRKGDEIKPRPMASWRRES